MRVDVAWAGAGVAFLGIAAASVVLTAIGGVLCVVAAVTR